MNITHEYLSGIIENNGVFKIDLIENTPIFKFLIVNNDIQLLYSIKDEYFPEIKMMLDSGISVVEIAKKFGVKRSSMFQFIKKFLD